MPFELVVIVIAALFLFSGSVWILKQKLIIWSVIADIAAMLLLVWMCAALFLVDRPIVDVTYYDVTQQMLPSGTYVDVALIPDENGKVHVVNVNDVFGLSLSNPLKRYKLVKFEYENRILGLDFSKTSRYRIIED